MLPFLQSHDTYGVDDSLRHCLAHGAQAAAAFLLERRGDVQSALRIYVEALEASNRDLVEAVKAGAALPAFAHAGPGSSPAAPQLRAPRLSPRPLGALALGAEGAPPELKAAQQAMRNAISMCLRCERALRVRQTLC